MANDGADKGGKPAEDGLLRHAHKISVLGKMLGSIAHDVNNSLTVMLMNVDALQQDKDLSERQRHRLDLMMNATQDGTKLVRTLLAFTRQLTFDPETICLAELLPDLAELAERALGKKVRVEIVLPPEPWYVTVDIAEFEVAVLYLALHIGDFDHRGGGELALKLANVASAEGDHVSLEIVRKISPEGAASDSGLARPSVPEDGLGLDMVTQFVREAGGTLDIKTAGIESTALLAFPRLNAESA